MVPVSNVRTVATVSKAPAAPKLCPVIDLLELMGTVPADSPSAILMACVSETSLSGVEVPWALT